MRSMLVSVSTMFQTVYNTVFVLCLCVSLSWCLRIDRCNKGIKSRLVQKVELSSNCTEGTLYWNYPQRTLQVDIPEKGRSFTVCIGYVNDPFVKRGRYTTSKESRLFYLPRKQGKSKCFDSNGGLSLKFFGPKRRKTYMAFIPYRILYAKVKNEELKVKTSNLI